MEDLILQDKASVRLLECIRLSSSGEGVCYDEGLVTFVPGLLPGESGEVKVVERKKNWQRAELLTLVKTAPERQDAPCRVFGVCGGCQLQHLGYEQTLQWKGRWVEDALRRIGKVQVDVSPALGMADPWRYRNKVKLHRDRNGKFGYYQEKSKDTVIFPDCLLISEDMNRWVGKVGELFGQDYPDVHTLTLRQNSRGEGLLILENAEATGPLADRFREAARDWFAQGIKEIWGLNRRGVPEQWLGRERIAHEYVAVEKTPARETFEGEHKEETVAQEAFENGFTEGILGLRFRVSPLAFLQVNHKQTEALYSLVLKWAGLSGNEIVWDLYCGIGSISLALARQTKKVIGIEENPFAIEDARQNAEENGLHNVEFFQGKVEERIGQLSQGQRNKAPDVVVVDPPRAGLQAMVTAKLIELKPGRIIYVSCDPGTLARDLGRVVKGGYSVERVQPVDMFPWTEHVESIIMMTYSGQKGK
ncbi:MAG: 23S rRNA (uracil(1939)-C(5))-methyltransferase RlmD [Desulfitobacteriaceae bacterium]